MRSLGLATTLFVCAASTSSLAACAPLTPCAGRLVRGGEELACPVPSWLDRSFALEVPPGWDGQSPLPVIFAFHGGGGNKRAARTTTCPEGKIDDPECLPRRAAAAGMAVVRPDGTGTRPANDIRTWNAGGGSDGWNCTSGGACKANVDDLGYFDALLAEVSATIPVDRRRIYLTGLSNGAAISHRIACERPELIAAIAAVGGGNQRARAGAVCLGAVPVLQIHGTEDPCWTYEESGASCIGSDTGIKVGVAETLEVWRTLNGCGEAPTEELLPDRDPNDGTRVTHLRWSGCRAALEHVRIDGGGHTWPNGHGYFGVDRVGRVSRDVGSEVIIEFFRAHTRDP